MSDHDSSTARGGAQGADHGDSGADEHGSADTLGPMDWPMWAVGVIGMISGLVMVAALAAASGFAFNA